MTNSYVPFGRQVAAGALALVLLLGLAPVSQAAVAGTLTAAQTVASSAAGADTQTAVTAATTANVTTANTQTAITATTTANVTTGANDQSATASTTTANAPAVSAVAQVDTLTVTQGTAEAGDVYTVTVDGHTVAYTTLGSEANSAAIATAIAAAVNADVTVGAIVTAATTAGGAFTLTANTPGTSFTASFAATNAPAGADNQAVAASTTTANASAVAAVAQVDTLTFTGTDTGTDGTGETLTGTITDAGGTTTFTITFADDADSTAATPTISAQATATGTPVQTYTVVAAAGSVTVTAGSAGTPFTSVTAVNDGADAANEITASNANTTANVAAASAVAQVSTLTATQGTAEAGDVYTVTVDGHTVAYTTLGSEANSAAIATAIAAAVNADVTVGAIVTAATTAGGAFTLTANTPGTSFTPTFVVANRAAGTNDQSATASTTIANSPAVAAVAQVSTLTATQGTAEAGDVYTVTVDGHAVAYTTLGSEANSAAIATALAAAINGDATVGAIVTAAATAGGAFTLTANTPGTSFTATFAAANRAAVAQVSTITIGGTVEVGDVFTATLPDVGAGAVTASFTATTATAASVAAGLNAAIIGSTGYASQAFTSAVSGSVITLTAKAAGTGFAVTSSTTNATPVAQVGTITIGGTVEVGDVFTATLPGPVTASFTATTTSVADVATGLNAAILASTGYASQDFTSAAAGSVITLTAKAAGTGFTVTSSTTNLTAVAQVVTFTPASVTAGETYIITLNGTNYSYTATGTPTVQTVVEGLQPVANAATGITCTEDNTKVTCTADTAGTAFTYSTSVVATGTIDRTITLAPGWNVLSTPQKLSAISFSNGGTGLTFYSLAGGTFATVAASTTTIAPLEGFLVNNTTSGNVDVYLTYATGLAPNAKIFQKSLSAGWNLLGLTTATNSFATIGSSATNLLDLSGADNAVDASYVSGTPATFDGLLGQAYAIFMSTTGIYGGNQ